MKTVCSSNMPFALEAFSTLGEVQVVEERGACPEDVRDADILAIRSTTQVNRDLLEGSAVKFVGTATIGTDHLDIPYLEERGIRWCSAAGCNANSVSEYFVAALLCLAKRHGFTFRRKKVGVIGVGNVGSLVVEKAEALGMKVLQSDPPKFDETGDARYLPLAEVLPYADIVTLHVPFTRGGKYPTSCMAGSAFFSRLKKGCIFVNASRGDVVDTDALLAAMNKKRVSHAVIDTWDGEPAFRKDLLDRVDIGTPHIAGHSLEGKVMGTVMVYQAACRFLNVAPQWDLSDFLPPSTIGEIFAYARGRRNEDVLADLVRMIYDIEADDEALRRGADGDDMARAQHFDSLRRNYAVRREFRFTKVALNGATRTLLKKVKALGFAV